MVDFYKWLTNNNSIQKVDIIITTLKNNNGGHFGLRRDGDEGWNITDGLLHPDELKNHFTEINRPVHVPSDTRQKLIKAIFKGSIKHI